MRKNRVNRWRFVGCLLPVFVWAGTAYGDMIQYQFSGVIDAISGRISELEGVVQVGDPYTAVFSFDADTPDLAPEDTRKGIYTGISATLVMPNLNVQTETLCRLDVFRRYVIELGTINILRFSAYSETANLNFAFNFYDPTGTSLIGDMLPTISEIETFEWGLFVGRLGDAGFDGTVFIPEPGTLSLLFAGMFGFCMRRRNR